MEMNVVVLTFQPKNPKKIYQFNLHNVNKVCNQTTVKLILKFNSYNKQLAISIIQFISVK